MFEQPLIASILMFPDCIYDLRVKPHHFKNLHYRNMYEAMLRLAEKKTVIDAFTLAGEMGVDSSQFMDLMMLLPSGSNYRAYERNVINEYKKSQLQALVLDLQEISDPNETGEKLVEKIDEIILDDEPKTVKQQIMDFTESLDQVYDCIPTPFDRLNYLMGGGLPLKDITVLAARPSVGKTAMMINLISRSLNSCVIFSQEMSYSQIVIRLFSYLYEIDSYAIKMRNPSAISRVMTHLSILNDIIIDDSSSLSANEIRIRLKAIMRQKPIRIVAIDYLGLMKHENGDTKAEKVGRTMHELKQIAKDMNVCILLLCQLNRLFSQRSNPKPVLSDLRESGDIEQDAAVVLFIYREADEHGTLSPDAELIISKQREGATGHINMSFQGCYSKFKETL